MHPNEFHWTAPVMHAPTLETTATGTVQFQVHYSEPLKFSMQEGQSEEV